MLSYTNDLEFYKHFDPDIIKSSLYISTISTLGFIILNYFI
jgi:hypothetical protein